MKLTSSDVEKIFIDCLFSEGENTSESVIVEGVRSNMGFHPDRILEHREEIINLVNELPDDFRAGSKAGGQSFLNAMVDKYNNHWGEHQSVEQLVCLGLAVGVIKYLMPKEMWTMLPGGMPYFQVVDAQKLREEKIDNILDNNE